MNKLLSQVLRNKIRSKQFSIQSIKWLIIVIKVYVTKVYVTLFALLLLKVFRGNMYEHYSIPEYRVSIPNIIQYQNTGLAYHIVL